MDDRIGASAPQPADGVVTSEGVNEGSRVSAAETADDPAQAVPPDRLLHGGRPEDADEQDREAVRHDRDREVIAGPWGASEASAPSLEQSVEEQRFRG